MNTLMKSLGALILLIGVGILTIPVITETPNNALLGSGLAIVVVGFLLHIFLNRKFE